MEQAHWPEAIYLTISEQLDGVERVLSEAIGSSEVPTIKEVSSHIISSGGKRFRPALAILSANICGHSGKNIIHLGAAIELIHTASIIHDDVLDNADLRRGVPAANARWGNHLSILVGDYCLSLASQLLAKHTNTGVISILTEAASKTTAGEILEAVNDCNISMNVDTYINIIRLKTACLIAGSCEAGSTLAEAPQKLIAALKDYGMNLGMAFQIVDDILDYTTDSTRLGKSKGTDLKEGKLTIPVICALKKCDATEKELIKESLLAPNFSAHHFDSVNNILNKYGCVDESKKAAEKYIHLAKETLAPFRPSLEKEALTKFADLVLSRKN